MSSWNIGMNWTPARAVRLADAIDSCGVFTPATLKLRAAAAANSPILGQRAEAAYREAYATASDRETLAAAVSDVILGAMGHAGDGDWVRDAVIRAWHLAGEPTAYSIARDSDGGVGVDTVARFLAGKSSMSTDRLGHVLRALRLTLAPIPNTSSPGE